MPAGWVGIVAGGVPCGNRQHGFTQTPRWLCASLLGCLSLEPSHCAPGSPGPTAGHVWVFEWTTGIHHLTWEEASLRKLPAPSPGLPHPAPSSSTEQTHPPHCALSVLPSAPDGCQRSLNRGVGRYASTVSKTVGPGGQSDPTEGCLVWML